MKRILVLILSLVLLFSSSSFASDSYAIAGYWYMYVDGNQYPEFMANIGNYDNTISLYYFSDSGKIFLLENDMLNESATPSFSCVGKWEKVQYSYKYNLIGIGEGTLTIAANMMKIVMPSSYSMVLRRVIPFDPYKNILN
jgi:hypothetical protein